MAVYMLSGQTLWDIDFCVWCPLFVYRSLGVLCNLPHLQLACIRAKLEFNWVWACFTDLTNKI